MFPLINKRETGVNLRRIMDLRGVTPKDVQEYLGFGCVQSVYRWLDGVNVPTVDNLYALSKLLQVPIDSLVCGNRMSITDTSIMPVENQERKTRYVYYRALGSMDAA